MAVQIPATHLDLMSKKACCHLATVAADGRPQVTPVWFDFDGKYLGAWTNLGRPFALKVEGGTLWVAGMTVESKASPRVFQVDPASGKILGQAEAPGPHSIDVNDAGEVFASGCCGGSSPTGFFTLRLH